ncbi:hypothetical protein lerEdw1_007633 [Lerista edwardsae]|nr:hypothetical protein lerEdw1_007633 [Lerista edwardsae]
MEDHRGPAENAVETNESKDLAVSPTAGKTPLLETASGSLFRPDPTASGTSKEQDTPLKQRGGEYDVPVPANPHQQPMNLEGPLLETPSLLEDGQAQKASSLQGPGGTPTSTVSVVLNASTFPAATSSSGAAADGVGWIPNQTSDLQNLLPETSLSLHTQIQPTLGVLPDAPEATAERDATGASDGSRSYTTGAKITGREDAAEGAEDPAASQGPGDLAGEAPRRRLRRSDGVSLDGFAVLSDDSCSSGNYTAKMSLQPGTAASTPSSPDSFLALIAVQDSGSRLTLWIKSCCVTPTAGPSGPEAACCLFPRSPRECGHIQLHQNGESGAASLSVQPFRVLNRSVAYLHCELSVCLSGQGGCGQGCLEHREMLPRSGDRSGYWTRHNLISVGPLWKDRAAFPSGPAAGVAAAVLLFPGPASAEMLSLLLGSLTGTAFFTAGAAILIWLHRKGKTKTADSAEHRGSCAP